MTLLPVIYLLGYIPAYYMIRASIRINNKEDWGWSSVLSTMLVALGSWPMFIIAFILYLPEKIKGRKPPKWL